MKKKEIMLWALAVVSLIGFVFFMLLLLCAENVWSILGAAFFGIAFAFVEEKLSELKRPPMPGEKAFFQTCFYVLDHEQGLKEDFIRENGSVFYSQFLTFGYVEEFSSVKSGMTVWSITPLGRQALEKANKRR